DDLPEQAFNMVGTIEDASNKGRRLAEGWAASRRKSVMADYLELRVLAPQREICDETVSQVVAQGTLGQFGVLPDHITFLTALEPGPLTFYPVAGGTETWVVKGGYAEVRDNVMTVLADD